MNKTNQSFFQKLLIFLFLALFILLVITGKHVILLLFTAALLAILWRGLTERIIKKVKMKKSLVLFLVILFNFLIFGILYMILAPSVAKQVDELSQRIPEAIERIESQIRNTAVGSRILRNVSEDMDIGKNLNQVLNVFRSTLNVLLDVLLIAVFAIFLAVNPYLYINGFLKLLTPRRRDRAQQVLMRLDHTLFRWFVGKIVDMFLTAVLTGIGLWLLDVPLVITFAVITFFLSFIPNIGPFLSAIPPILISLVDSPTKALYVALMYAAVQMFESYMITPNVQRHAIRMPPLLLLVVQIFFASYLGVLALFLSTPILATVIILVQMLYIEDILGDRNEIENS
ncbi:MAG: AI-2E family transporter [Candidatus Cyclobacteriaceae bacterium M3_2C_046]